MSGKTNCAAALRSRLSVSNNYIFQTTMDIIFYIKQLLNANLRLISRCFYAFKAFMDGSAPLACTAITHLDSMLEY